MGLIDCTLHLIRQNSERHASYRILLLEKLVVPCKICGFHSVAGEDSRSADTTYVTLCRWASGAGRSRERSAFAFMVQQYRKKMKAF